MKLGTESRGKTGAAVVLMLFAGVFAWRTFFTDSRGETAPQSPAPVTPGVARKSDIVPRSRAKPTAITAPSLDPRLQLNLLRSSEQIAYSGSGRNIFEDQAEAPPPPPKRGQGPGSETPKPPPGPPPPPPINLKFFGFATQPGQPKQVFLAEGDDVFVAKQGDIVDRRYKVLEIQPNAVVIQDVLNNHTQSIPLVQG